MSNDFVQIANDVVTGAGLLRQGAPDAMTALAKAATALNALDTKSQSEAEVGGRGGRVLPGRATQEGQARFSDTGHTASTKRRSFG